MVIIGLVSMAQTFVKKEKNYDNLTFLLQVLDFKNMKYCMRERER